MMGWVRERRGWVGLLPHKVKGEEEDSQLNCRKEFFESHKWKLKIVFAMILSIFLYIFFSLKNKCMIAQTPQVST